MRARVNKPFSHGRLMKEILGKSPQTFLLLLSIAILTPGSALAQRTTIIDSSIVSSGEHSSSDAVLDEQRAKVWGLEREEWSRYQQLMQGPLGIYSPALDPLSALGIEARSDEERQRYAELQVQAEAHRVEKLLAYQRAYDEAWQRLHPTLLRVDLSNKNVFDQAAFPGPRPLSVFVTEDCPACEQRVKQLMTDGLTFDLYLVDSLDDDTRIRRWAAQVGIEPGKVRDRTITLNHDNGRWRSLNIEGELPAVLREVNGQWRRF